MFYVPEHEFCDNNCSGETNLKPFKTFNPELGTILNTINRYNYKKHKVRLTYNHIKKYHRNIAIDSENVLFTKWKSKKDEG